MGHMYCIEQKRYIQQYSAVVRFQSIYKEKSTAYFKCVRLHTKNSE